LVMTTVSKGVFSFFCASILTLYLG
jgi:hypothetical protein